MKKKLTLAIISLLLISTFSIIVSQVIAKSTFLGASEVISQVQHSEQIIKWVNDTVKGSYDYYVPYRLSSLEELAYGSYVRIVAQKSTTVTIEGVGSFLLNAGEMVEFDLPAGTHIRSDYPLTIQVYDDYWCDWDSLYLPPVQEWGRDYWYAGLRSFACSWWPWPEEGKHYLFITSAFDGTHVEIDIDHDSVPEKAYDLNAGDVVAYEAQSTWVSKGAWGYDIEDDPRAGAHITSNNPIMVHAWATHEHYFGSGYLLLPTEALGTDYYVPFVPCSLPDETWDDWDKIIIVGTQANTFVSIDENNDGVPELTRTINAGERIIYPEIAKSIPFLSGTRVTSDKPIGVVYSSPHGIHYWDGGATQIVPKESALTEYWNTVSKDTYNYKDIHSFGDSYVLIFAFETNTVVNIDRNNDGIIDDTFTIDPGDELQYKVYDPGYHIFSDKPIFAAEVWWYLAGGEIEMLGFKTRAIEKWSFAIITDLHIGWCYEDYGGEGFGDEGPGQDYWLTDRLNGIVNWINANKGKYNIKFVVVLGDIADSAEYSEFLKAKEILNGLIDPNRDGNTEDGIPYIPIIGNHDVFPYTQKGITPLFRDIRKPKDQYWILSDYGDYYFNKVFWEENTENIQKINEIFRSSWKKQYTEFHKLQDSGQMALLQNYLWIYNGIKFIALDFVDRRLDSGSPHVYSETRAWLTENLEGKEPIILFSHHLIGTDIPTYDVQEIGDAIRRGSRILANFAGHDHDNDEITATWLYWDYSVSIKAVTTEAVCRESTWWHPSANTKNNIRIVTLFKEGIEDYNTFGNIDDETHPFKRRMFISKSPVDLIISDPEGYAVSKWVQEVAGMFYVEFDVNSDGKLDDIIFLEELKMGDYRISVIPEIEASLTDTYTLEFVEFDMREVSFNIIFAYNVQVCNIPEQPYVMRVTETEVIPIIPATVDFDPDTLNLRDKGLWVTVYLELPVGHGYSVNMINLTSITLNEQIWAEAKPMEIGDYDGDGIPDLMIKFNKTAVQKTLQVGENVEITISGKLVDGRVFEGKDIIRVILPPLKVKYSLFV